MSREVKSFTLGEDTLVFEYADLPDDIRLEGAVVVTRTLYAHPGHPAYREDVEGVWEAVRTLLGDILDAYEESEAYVPPPPEDTHEEMGY